MPVFSGVTRPVRPNEHVHTIIRTKEVRHSLTLSLSRAPRSRSVVRRRDTRRSREDGPHYPPRGFARDTWRWGRRTAKAEQGENATASWLALSLSRCIIRLLLSLPRFLPRSPRSAIARDTRPHLPRPRDLTKTLYYPATLTRTHSRSHSLSLSPFVVVRSVV